MTPDPAGQLQRLDQLVGAGRGRRTRPGRRPASGGSPGAARRRRARRPARPRARRAGWRTGGPAPRRPSRRTGPDRARPPASNRMFRGCRSLWSTLAGPGAAASRAHHSRDGRAQRAEPRQRLPVAVGAAAARRTGRPRPGPVRTARASGPGACPGRRAASISSACGASSRCSRRVLRQRRLQGVGQRARVRGARPARARRRAAGSSRGRGPRPAARAPGPGRPGAAPGRGRPRRRCAARRP